MPDSSKSSSSWLRTVGFFSALCGFLLSVYSSYVSTTKTANKEYEAYCDISSSVSCSKIFTSEYGYGFGILQHVFGKDSIFNCSNSIFGTIFYTLQMLGFLVNWRFAQSCMLWLSGLSLVMCVYLAYILAFVLHDFCVVCVSTYIINLVLFALNLSRVKRRGRRQQRTKTRRKEE